MALVRAVGDTPAIAATAHTHTAYSPVNFVKPLGEVHGKGFDWGDQNVHDKDQFVFNIAANQFKQQRDLSAQAIQEIVNMATTLRRVQVFIADTNDNIPLEKRMLYEGPPKLTDLTDQELFFEIDIKNILDAWNLERVKIIDKHVKERTEYLEPIKIRELKMVVTTIAAF